MKDDARFILLHGNCQELLSYRKAEIVYVLTFRFCHRFVDKTDRTMDQMIQAARSGKQNIVEGSKASGISKDYGEDFRAKSIQRQSGNESLRSSPAGPRCRREPVRLSSAVAASSHY